MATETPEPILVPSKPARKRGQPYGPGLTPSVLIIAALAFLLLMGSGSMVLVQTLTATQEKLQTWPVARRTLPSVANPNLPGSGATADPTAALIAGDRAPTTTPMPSSGTTVISDPWLKYFPEMEKHMANPPALTREDYYKLMYNTPRTGSLGWALLDPRSPFSRTTPDSPHMARLRARLAEYEAQKALGFPEDPKTGKLTAEEEKQADAYFDAWEKKYKELEKQNAEQVAAQKKKQKTK